MNSIIFPLKLQFGYSRVENVWPACPKWLTARGIHCCPNFWNFFCPTSVSILWITCVYIYTYLTAYRLCMNYRRYQIIMKVKLFKQIGSGAKCWPDIYRCGAGLAVTGRIRGIGQKVWKFCFKQQTVAAQLLPHFLLYRNPRGRLY
jgi:hypothetical protein